MFVSVATLKGCTYAADPECIEGKCVFLLTIELSGPLLFPQVLRLEFEFAVQAYEMNGKGEAHTYQETINTCEFRPVST